MRASRRPSSVVASSATLALSSVESAFSMASSDRPILVLGAFMRRDVAELGRQLLA